MDIVDFSQLRKEWVKKEKEKIENDKKRRYLHFDSRITLINQKLLDEVFNPDYVVRRFFYPFLHDLQVIRKYKKVNGRKFIDKKERPLCYASHKDAFIFSWYAYILDHLYEIKIKELGISENVIAYRSLGFKNVHFVKEVFDFIKKKGNCAAICFDIRGFFDNLDHVQIKKVWRSLLLVGDMLDNGNLPDDHYAVYKAITGYSYVSKKSLFPSLGINKKNIKQFFKVCNLSDYQQKVRESSLIKKHEKKCGIPQGISISSVLSNAYMMEFDISVADCINKIDGFYRRYCDDIIVICPKGEYKGIKNYIEEKIEIAKLKIQKEKTEIRFFKIDKQGLCSCTNEEGFSAKLQYLGIETDGNNTWLRGKTEAKNYRKISWAVRKEKFKSKKFRNNFSKRKIYKKFVYKKERSYLAYARSAASILDSEKIKKLIVNNRLMKIIRRKIDKYKK